MELTHVRSCGGDWIVEDGSKHVVVAQSTSDAQKVSMQVPANREAALQVSRIVPNMKQAIPVMELWTDNGALTYRLLHGDPVPIETSLSDFWLDFHKDKIEFRRRYTTISTATLGSEGSWIQKAAAQGPWLPPEEFWLHVKDHRIAPYRILYSNAKPGETLYMLVFYTYQYQVHVHIGRGGEVLAAHLKDQAGKRHWVNLIEARLVLMYWSVRLTPQPASNIQGVRAALDLLGLEDQADMLAIGDIKEVAQMLMQDLKVKGEDTADNRLVAAAIAVAKVNGGAIPLLVAAMAEESAGVRAMGAITEITFGSDWSHFWVGLPNDMVKDVGTFMGMIGTILGVLAAIPGANVAVPILAGILAAYAAAIVGANQGNGVWIDVYWISPGVLIPKPA